MLVVTAANKRERRERERGEPAGSSTGGESERPFETGSCSVQA